MSIDETRLRVVVLDHCAQLSGAELALVRLLPRVAGVDYTVLLAEEGPLVDRLREVGIDVEVLPLAARTAEMRRDQLGHGRLPVRALVDSLSYTWQVARHLGRLHPDVVHTNSNKAHLYGGVAARVAGVPQLWHARDRVARPYMPLAAVAVSRMAAWTLPSGIVANSRSTQRTLLRRGPWKKLSVVLAEPVMRTVTVPIREPLVDALRIGMVGRLTPWKGQDVFLHAFAAAFPAGDITAVLVGSAMFGEDEYEHELHELAGRLGIAERVTFVGFTDDVDGELARMDVLVHASVIPEPFGQVVIEGMAAGLPVLAADDGGPAEILEHNVTGFLHRPGDAQHLTEQLRMIAADAELRSRLGAAARAATATYEPDLLAGQLRDVYVQLATRRRRAPGRFRDGVGTGRWAAAAGRVRRPGRRTAWLRGK